MERVYIKKRFTVFVPFEADETIFELNPHPAFTLAYNEVRLAFTVKLLSKQTRLTSQEYEQPDCLCWATKIPFAFRKRIDAQQQPGLLLQLKVKQGVFDFRKIDKNLARVQIDCNNAEGQLLNSATSEYFQLLPRKRKGDFFIGDRSEVVLPVQWKSTSHSINSLPTNQNLFAQNSDTDPTASEKRLLDQIEHYNNHHNTFYSSIDNGTNNINHTAYALESSDSDVVHQSNEELSVLDQDPLLLFQSGYPIHEPQHEQYMVLYNGNAEVVGNFRALNFYKASDINIKEDIRLLSEDYNPRGVMLKIDGVSYKFKKGTSNATNRRFVGYIAQQIESVVPEAVQLIDGILHVDYESLIPYLSESIKQNYDDLKDIKSDQQHLEAIIDILYNEFLKREQVGKTHQPFISGRTDNQSCAPQRAIIAVLSIVLTVSVVMIGLYFAVDMSIDDNNPPSVPSLSITPQSMPLPSSSPLPSVIQSPPNPALIPIVPIAPPLEPESPDRQALLDLYEATNGDYWQLDDGADWLSSAPMCQWSGVKCKNGRVTEINLNYSNVRGTIPDSIYKLDALQQLELARNYLTGTIPTSIARMKALETLNLAENPSLTGTIPDLPESLIYFFVNKCNLTGTIPSAISTMPNLSSLQLSWNQFHGTIPTLPSKVSAIGLNNNKFEGSVPIIQATSNVWLDVSNNSLSGTLENLAVVPMIDHLWISNNNFSGEVHVFNMTSLNTLFIDGNQFTSCNQTNLPGVMKCKAEGNPFKCRIPSWLRRFCNAKCTW